MNEVAVTRRLCHPVDRVWRAVEDPAELEAWCPGPPGEVVERDAPRRIAWTNAGHTVTFDLEPDGDGTLLTLTHAFPSGDSDGFAAGWEIYLGRLASLLAGVPLGEQEAHDERRLVLGDGPELRLERRFLVGVDRLWRALTETGELAHWFPGDMEVVEAEAPHRLVARWNGSTLSFALSADGDVTRLTFVHAFDDRDQAAMTAAGWDRCFARLDALVSGAPRANRSPWSCGRMSTSATPRASGSTRRSGAASSPSIPQADLQPVRSGRTRVTPESCRFVSPAVARSRWPAPPPPRRRCAPSPPPPRSPGPSR